RQQTHRQPSEEFALEAFESQPRPVQERQVATHAGIVNKCEGRGGVVSVPGGGNGATSFRPEACSPASPSLRTALRRSDLRRYPDSEPRGAWMRQWVGASARCRGRK